DVGGDVFDVAENRDGAWLTVGDAMGKGLVAAGIGSVALAALRAARRNGLSLEEAAQSMHEVVHDVTRAEGFATAVLARWHVTTSVFSWICCGHPPPLLLHAGG